MQGYEITGDWTPADDSNSRLEIAPTSQNGVFALRNSHTPDATPVTATVGQLGNLAERLQGGGFKDLGIGQ